MGVAVRIRLPTSVAPPGVAPQQNDLAFRLWTQPTRMMLNDRRAITQSPPSHPAGNGEQPIRGRPTGAADRRGILH